MGFSKLQILGLGASAIGFGANLVSSYVENKKSEERMYEIANEVCDSKNDQNNEESSN